MNAKTMVIGAMAMMFGAAACQGDDVPIGDDGDTEEQTSPLVASWKGHVELHAFRSGSDAITIDIESVDGTEVTGKVRFGDGPLVGAPTNAEEGYPENARFDREYSNPFEGIAFTIRDSKLIEGQRLQFKINGLETWKNWCEMQTATYPISSNAAGEPKGWGCESAAAFDGFEAETCSKVDPVTQQEVPVDCWKTDLCFMNVCSCDEEGCTTADDGGPYAANFELTFDIQMTEEHGDGSVDGLDREGLRNVRVDKLQ